jgi:hypothetical protein
MSDSPESTPDAEALAGLGEPYTSVGGSRRPATLAVLPWVISLVFHAFLIGVAAFVIYAVQADDDRGFLSLTSFDQSESDTAVDPVMPTLAPVRSADLPTPDLDFDRSQADLSRLDAELSRAAGADLSIVGIGGEAENTLDGWRMLSSGQGGGLKAEFFGQRSRGNRIIYVIDRSGSMADSFDFLRTELKRSIGDLSHSQKFHVILFNDAFIEMPPGKLVPAIAANKRRCFDFLDQVHPGGMTDPIPAMRRAFRKKPDLIFFLTDGEFSPALLVELRKWNKKERVRIFTLAYIYASGSNLLKKIASEHGGTYTFVDGTGIR